MATRKSKTNPVEKAVEAPTTITITITITVTPGVGTSTDLSLGEPARTRAAGTGDNRPT